MNVEFLIILIVIDAIFIFFGSVSIFLLVLEIVESGFQDIQKWISIHWKMRWLEQFETGPPPLTPERCSFCSDEVEMDFYLSPWDFVYFSDVLTQGVFNIGGTGINACIDCLAEGSVKDFEKELSIKIIQR